MSYFINDFDKHIKENKGLLTFEKVEKHKPSESDKTSIIDEEKFVKSVAKILCYFKWFNDEDQRCAIPLSKLYNLLDFGDLYMEKNIKKLIYESDNMYLYRERSISSPLVITYLVIDKSNDEFLNGFLLQSVKKEYTKLINIEMNYMNYIRSINRFKM